MLPVVWKNSAKNDLMEIIGYIADKNPDAAERFKTHIEKAAELLSIVPMGFRKGITLGTREYLVHPNYFLVYEIEAGQVSILRVIHSRRQYP
ncbi:type II toxin-antitoxin system mRNA interferase toxin, RelE/StbE family [Lysobacteraceae bacterium NML120232]|nr:type II toxin-antitoxin system mRNA interferase toxin, RelE/StbE family [Xanthomonadaceae bacterium NML08-0793]PJK11674.1 type II toxin-antitoxin system mRNA interferase toxin, RelE/StbE family [Xanthomonadaceae bacterium NML120232]